MPVNRLLNWAAAALALTAAPLHAQSDAPHFADKTITFVLSVPAGSGADIHGRLMARHIREHIPGNPQTVVVNRPGGRGSVARNFVYESGDADGTTLYYGEWGATAVIEGDAGVRYVPEEMGQVGSAASNLAFVARRDKIPDTAALPEVEDLIVGGRGATQTIEVLGNLSLRVLDVPFRYVGGFGGFSKIQAAIKAGEVHGGHAGLTGYNRFFGAESDVAWPVYYHPTFDENNEPMPLAENTFPEGTKSLIEVHNELYGSDPSGPYWDAYVWHRNNVLAATVAVLTAPGVSDEVLTTLQEAYQATVTDEDYLQEYRDTIGAPPPFNPTAVTEKIFANYRDVPPAVQETLAEIGGL